LQPFNQSTQQTQSSHLTHDSYHCNNDQRLRLRPPFFVTFAIAIFGLLIAIAGNFLDISVAKKLCYLIGALVLGVSAALERNSFFTIFEIILSIGAAMAFFQLPTLWKAGIPISLGIAAAIYFGMRGKLNDYLTWLSVLSLLLGTWGYALTNPVIYCWAGAITMIYSFCAFNRGEKIALAFGILNAVFTITALLEVLQIPLLKINVPNIM
jgi:hypothetical protein